MKTATFQRATKAIGLADSAAGGRYPGAHVRYYWIWQLVLAIVTLIAIEFLRRVSGSFHGYHREQFRLVRWCIVANLCGGLLISVYAFYRSWLSGLRGTLIADGCISLFAICFPVVAHFSSGSLPVIYLFNLVFGIFLLGKYATFTYFACRNAITAPTLWQSCYIFASSLIVLATFARWYNVSEVPEADEPHYTLLTYSLIHDHDFDLTNNYANRDYAEQFPPTVPTIVVDAPMMDVIRREPHVITTFRGQRLLWHDIGLPILIVPGYFMAKRLGALLTITVIAALLPLAALDVALLLGADVVSSIIAATVFTVTPPAILFATTIFTEIIGATAILWMVLLFLRYRRSGSLWNLCILGVMFALLPWINIRFWVLQLPLFLVVTAYIIWQWRQHLLQVCLRLFVLGVPTVASLGTFAWFDHVHFNSYLPNAGYRILQLSMPQFWHKPYLGLIGLLFDRSDGLAPTAPLYLLCLAGLIVLMRRDRWATAALLLPCLGYVGFLSFSQYWWGGWNPGGRYLLSAIALLIPASAFVITRQLRWYVAPLAAWTLAVDLVYISRPHCRWPVGYYESGLVRYLHQSLGQFGHAYSLLSIFPNLLNPTPRDYVVGTCWLTGVCLLAWWFARRAARGTGAPQSGRTFDSHE